MYQHSLIILLIVGASAVAAPRCTDCSNDALRAVASLEAQKFNCSLSQPVSLGRAFRCRGQVTNYSEPINIFVPPWLSFERAINIAYFFHGWWITKRLTPFTGDDGDYGRFLAESQQNTVLIIPESHGRNATYASDLGTPAKMLAFITNVDSLLKKSGVAVTPQTSRILAGHSGAYVQLDKIGAWASSGQLPALSTLKAIGLFDTAYEYRSGLVKLMDVMCINQRPSYFIAFNPNDGSVGKRNANQKILRELKTNHLCPRAQVTFHSDTRTHHTSFPRRHMVEFLRSAGS